MEIALPDIGRPSNADLTREVEHASRIMDQAPSYLSGRTPAPPDLNPRDREALDTLRRMIQAKGYAPTVRELGDELRLRSSSTTHALLQRLRNAGRVTWVNGSPRTLQVLDVRGTT